jgi:putative transposase
MNLYKSGGKDRALVTTLTGIREGSVSRNVKTITEKLCGTEVSVMQVSRAATQLDGVLQEWRERPLGDISYLN